MSESQTPAEQSLAEQSPAEQSREGPSSLPGKKKNRYDAKYKLKVIESAEIHSNREAGRKCSVGESSVRDWRKVKNKLTELPSKRCRQPGGGRKAQAPDMEEALTAWIEELRGSHARVTRTSIQKKALELYEGNSFAASRGWLENFFRRNGFSLRRKTTVSQRLPQDVIPKVSSFILHMRKLQLLHQY